MIIGGVLCIRIHHPFWWNQPVVHPTDICRRYLYPLYFTDRRVVPLFREPESFPVPRTGMKTRRLTTRSVRSLCELLLYENEKQQSTEVVLEDNKKFPHILFFVQTYFQQSPEDTFFIGDENYLAHRLDADDGHATICVDAADPEFALGVMVTCSVQMKHHGNNITQPNIYMVELEIVQGGDVRSEHAQDLLASHLRNQVIRDKKQYEKAPITLFRRRTFEPQVPNGVFAVSFVTWSSLTVRLFQKILKPQSNKTIDFVAPIQLRRITNDPLFWGEFENILNAHFKVHILSQFARTQANNKNQTHFFVFALESMRTFQTPQSLLGIYFFNEPQFQYALADNGLSIHCAASICLTADILLFQCGFKVALRHIAGFIKNIRALVLDGTSHNHLLPPVEDLGDVIHTYSTDLYAHNTILVPVQPNHFFYI